jgi:hypothetical protein
MNYLLRRSAEQVGKKISVNSSECNKKAASESKVTEIG